MHNVTGIRPKLVVPPLSTATQDSQSKSLPEHACENALWHFGEWRSLRVLPLGYRVSSAALGFDVSYDRSWKQRAYICRRHEHIVEIAECSKGMDSMRLSVAQFSLEVLGKQICFFMCCDTFSPKRSVSRIYWKFWVHALHWFFLCLGFLKTWERCWLLDRSAPEPRRRLRSV